MARKLHIGGKTKSEGWEVLNAQPAPYVDHICDACELAQFADDTFSEIYASHVVEHFDYNLEILHALTEWLRILEPGGRALISVPDLDVLATLLLAKDQLTVGERFQVMQIIFGGHQDKYDYHAVGLNEDFLTELLRQAGYVNIKKVNEFGLFQDASSTTFKGVPISLNMIAEKPRKPEK